MLDRIDPYQVLAGRLLWHFAVLVEDGHPDFNIVVDAIVFLVVLRTRVVHTFMN